MFGFGMIFWVVIIWWIVSMSRNGGGSCCGMGNHGKVQGEDNAMDILRKRYAKGEIEKEEFERMKNQLQ